MRAHLLSRIVEGKGNMRNVLVIALLALEVFERIAKTEAIGRAIPVLPEMGLYHQGPPPDLWEPSNAGRL